MTSPVYGPGSFPGEGHWIHFADGASEKAGRWHKDTAAACCCGWQSKRTRFVSVAAAAGIAHVTGRPRVGTETLTRRASGPIPDNCRFPHCDCVECPVLELPADDCSEAG